MRRFKGTNRKQLLVDLRVQGALVLRVIFYWCMCLISLTIMLLVWRLLTDPTRMFLTHLSDLWADLGPAAIASLLLLPLVIVDVLQTSHRFTGPLWRLRGAMRKLARGEEVEPLRFRRGDFWHQIAEEFNAVAARIESERRQHAADEDASLERAPVAADAGH
jgi:hypothetical protein